MFQCQQCMQLFHENLSPFLNNLEMIPSPSGAAVAVFRSTQQQKRAEETKIHLLD